MAGRRRRTEDGISAVVVILVILTLSTMLAATLAESSISALVGERDRLDRERARLNAQSAVLDADDWLKGEILPELEDLVEAAIGADYPLDDAGLVATTFPTYTRRFAMHGADSTPDDWADVTATITLAGPPMQRTIEGPRSSSAPIRVDEYRFRIQMVIVGHSARDAQATYGHEAHVLIELKAAPNQPT